MALLMVSMTAAAQKFFNLTAEEVRIDSVLPVFDYRMALGEHYADSTYQVSIVYPECVPMGDTDIARYKALVDRRPGALPEIQQMVSVDRKKGTLHVSFIPIVYRDGRYQKLVSFMLKVKGKSLSKRLLKVAAQRRANAVTGRYADNSVLASGRWVKIRVPSTGLYKLTGEMARLAGFSDVNRVKVYGYGGAMQPEKLTPDYLTATDDLKEVPTCAVNGNRLFYAVGPVSWNDNHRRVRNPYSNYGYYFLTEDGGDPNILNTTDFLNTCYPMADDYASLYEVDDYAWYHGGRNLYNAQQMGAGAAGTFTISDAGTTSQGTMTVVLSAAGAATGSTASPKGAVAVMLNGTTVGSVALTATGSYEKMHTSEATFTVSNLQGNNQVTLVPNVNSGTVRLDYISIHADQPKGAPDLSQDYPQPEIVGEVTNQNHHADTAADMIIIIPTSCKLLAQAQRLQALHTERDGLRVRIVPADELFNEYSSGTPDANAYRRYLKMLYDRATTEADMPRFLLLLGDGAWDNRMLLSDWSNESPDDFLLCYESENSYSETDCYVTDDYFCLLDDNEGGNMLTSDKADVAVGRISARTAEEAAVAVDKIEAYMNNQQAGSWQNLICFMGDDGNQNQHMADADSVAKVVEQLRPDMVVKRIMWDAYERVSSATGDSYPDVERLIKQQMQQGALVMNYSGHGRADAISHEYVLRLTDFKTATSQHLPLWMTASCDIMPFDGQVENIGETAFFNKKGGAIAFYGTTRTVYQTYNRLMNIAFTRNLFSKYSDGRPMPIGEAVRRAKSDLMTAGVLVGYNTSGPIRSTDRTANKLQYTLLGDPALRLAIPTLPMVVDAINDQPLADGTLTNIKAGSTAKVTGRVLTADGQTNTAFNGVLTATVRDVKEKVTCRLNNTSSDGAQTPFVYYDRLNTVYSGSNDVTNGQFTFTFAVPKDIKYSDLDAMINLYAVNTDKTQEASGFTNGMSMNGTADGLSSETGPNIYCYLNSANFTNGGKVNTTPYFVAELNDEDGINASGGGIGHDLQLVIDGDMAKTYSLNNYFEYDFGSYTSGKLGFSIPELSYGQHKLVFRAWDVLNNSSTAELDFEVVKGLEPLFIDVECSPNPARTHTQFRIIHDRIGSEMDVKLDVYDTSGRHLWTYSENGVSTDNTYTVDWDLTVDGGRRLMTGLYLYRLSISTDGSTYASKAKKLIVLTYK